MNILAQYAQMRSHARHNKRNRPIKGHDDEHYMGTEAEDMHSESYARIHESSRRGDYRTATSSSRLPVSYEPARESASSRRHHVDDWRRDEDVESRHYLQDDSFLRHGAGHDDRTLLEPREPESWPPGQYSDSRSDWSQRYDYTPYSYGESSSRNTSNHHRDSRTAPLDHWRDADRQMHPPDDRHLTRESANWRQDQRREKGGQKYQSDSGWGSQRRHRVWNESSSNWDDFTHEKDQHIPRERTWEPAPGWHPPTHNNSSQDERSAATRTSHPSREERGTGTQASHTASTSSTGRNTYSYSNTNSRNKRNTQTKSKRDWKDDDSSLNNWQRREFPTSGTFKPPPRKKQRKSPSPSRSRSPAESFHSRRSWDRSRSRSHSPVPKRRRRGDISPLPETPNFNEAERALNWVPDSHDLPPYSLKSPHPVHRSTAERPQVMYPPTSRGGDRDHSPTSQKSYSGDRGRSILHPNARYAKEATTSPASYSRRRRSLSSVSSDSTRSLSHSPPGRARAVHRLPPANADIVLTPATTPHVTSSKKSTNQKNGRTQTNGKRQNGERQRNIPPTQQSNDDSMPPPTSIPSQESRASFPLREDHPPAPSYPPAESLPSSYNRPMEAILEPSSGLSRRTPVKNAGFRPINQASSSLKKFFPGDEDDIDSSLDASFVPANEGDDRTHTINSVPLPIRHEKKVWPSPQSAPSPRPSSPPARVDNATRFDAGHFVPAEVRPPSSMDLSTQRSLSSPPKSPSATADNETFASQGELYKILSQVGEGTFGKVYKAQNTTSKVYVALKRIRMESEKDGFPVTAMREIKLLQSLKHPNVVRLYEMMVSTGSVYMVFEYMDHDLTGVLSQTQFNFTDAHLKSLCHQMLAGLAYLHHKGVIHRDIKGSNILVNNRGELKLGDFGLARFYHKRRRADYTNRVITLWYRPPELLFGATVYGPEVDMWSAGCIMLELFTKKPVFQGNDEIHQLDTIYKIFGTPTSERWTGIMDLPWYELVKPREAIPNRFRDLFQKWMSSAALDLAEHLLAYNPLERATATQAMGAYYFTDEEPKAMLPAGLATLDGEWHELETKRERAKKKRKESTTTESQHV
ncbi:hypothetical protein H0H93_009540 [Arthromyces matolae]|nr:hypothetical protein H0H93_009540 [Arthromyces matolae]